MQRVQVDYALSDAAAAKRKELDVNERTRQTHATVSIIHRYAGSRFASSISTSRFADPFDGVDM